MKLGVIGCGKMATALVKGVISSEIISAEHVLGISRTQRSAELFAQKTGGRITDSLESLMSESDLIMIATKPKDALPILRQAAQFKNAEQTLISVVAGLTIDGLSEAFGRHEKVIRSMPNTPSLIGEGATGYSLSTACSGQEKELANQFFSSVGLCFEVPEHLLNAVTGLSGSGPAYIYTIIEALADGAVKEGLPRDQALALATQTLVGAAAMVKSTREHPAVLRDQVTSPGGTTIAGLAAMETLGVRAAMIGAVSAATKRAVELGR